MEQNVELQHAWDFVEHTGRSIFLTGKAGTTSPMAAEAMKIPRYQLTAWVKASGHQSFTKWIIAQRIEEAKRVLTEHSDWTNEAVADHCGFNRTHFQKIFKQATGMAPSEFVGER